jgi:hypothetical protein
MHVDWVNYHSSQYDRIRRICEDARQLPSIPGNLFRWD